MLTVHYLTTKNSLDLNSAVAYCLRHKVDYGFNGQSNVLRVWNISANEASALSRYGTLNPKPKETATAGWGSHELKLLFANNPQALEKAIVYCRAFGIKCDEVSWLHKSLSIAGDLAPVDAACLSTYGTLHLK